MAKTPPELDAVLRTLAAGDLQAVHATITGRTLAGATRATDELGADQTLAADPSSTVPGESPRPASRDTLERLPRLTLRGAGGLPAQLDVGDVLGAGGMGVVRRATQTALDREVAVKTLRGEGEPGASAELVSEARIMGQLEHPNVVPVHMLGEDDRGQPVVVMKRIEGKAWGELARNPDDPILQAFEGSTGDSQARHLRIFMQVCRALEFAHDRGVLHRDVKPENVMVGSFGEVYLLDWGIAIRLDERHLAPPGSVVGTPACIAPEMLTGAADVDARTDVFLLGATLYEVLTGRARHAGKGVHEVLANAWDCEPPVFPDDSVPAELQQILVEATARDKDERPPTVGALRQRVAEHLEHRASVQLTARADAAARELDTAIEAARTNEEARPAALTAFTRCRQAYFLALDVWPDNRAAREGQARVFRRMFDFHVDTRQGEAAAALLDEMGDGATEEQRARLETLRAELADERAAATQLASMRRELDLGVARKERGALLLALAASALIVTGVLFYLAGQGVDMMQRPALFGLALAFFASYGVAVAILRRVILSTKINRRIVLGVGVVLGGLVLNRGAALLTRTPPNQVLVNDILVSTVITLCGAVAIDRRIAWLTALCVPALFVAAWRPVLSQGLYPAIVVTGILGTVLWRRRLARS